MEQRIEEEKWMVRERERERETANSASQIATTKSPIEQQQPGSHSWLSKEIIYKCPVEE